MSRWYADPALQASVLPFRAGWPLTSNVTCCSSQRSQRRHWWEVPSIPAAAPSAVRGVHTPPVPAWPLSPSSTPLFYLRPLSTIQPLCVGHPVLPGPPTPPDNPPAHHCSSHPAHHPGRLGPSWEGADSTGFSLWPLLHWTLRSRLGAWPLPSGLGECPAVSQLQSQKLDSHRLLISFI